MYFLHILPFFVQKFQIVSTSNLPKKYFDAKSLEISHLQILTFVKSKIKVLKSKIKVLIVLFPISLQQISDGNQRNNATKQQKQ